MRPSKSSISELERLRRKLKFQEKGRVESRIEEIEIFLSETTINSLGYWFKGVQRLRKCGTKILVKEVGT